MSTSEHTALSPARREWLRRRRVERTLVLAAKIGLLAGLIVLWEAAARLGWIDPFITSQPTRVLATLRKLWINGDLMRHVLTTTLEATAGFLFGTVFGTAIAVLLWSSNFLCRVLEPYLIVLNALPKIALGPIFVVWLGAGTTSIVVIALSISLIVTVLEVLGGFLGTDEDMIRLLRTFGAKKLTVLRLVVFPANIPTIVGALKINVGMSWVGGIVGEFLVSKAGLGYLIVYGSQVFQLDLVMASVVILAGVATLMLICIQWTEQMLFGSKHPDT
jgi:NitT/TauT family transport system permease protein